MTIDFLKHFDKTKTPRKVQIDMLEWLASCWGNGKPKVLSAPVASGKSAIALAVAKYNESCNTFTAINTCTNILVDQYANDFPEENTLKGAGQYICCTAPDYTCEERRLIQKGSGRNVSDLDCYKSCPYIAARRNTFKKKITFYNPLSYIYMQKKLFHEKRLIADCTPETLIVDEFHNLPNMLRGQFETVLWQDDIDWKAGTCNNLSSVLEVLNRRKDLLRKTLSAHIPDKKRMQLERELQRLCDVSTAAVASPQLFVAEEKIDKKYGRAMRQLSLRPVIVPPEYAKRFFADPKNVVLMSGTAFPHTYKELGLSDVDYYDCPSPIAKERRQIYIRSVIKNSLKINQTLLLETIAREISRIVNLHKNENGIVLATYKQAAELQTYLTDDCYMFHDKDNKAQVISEFVKKSSKRKVAVLAGSWEGLDLKDDISRFTIITKLPFANLGDKVVQRKKELDEITGKGTWYGLEAMQFVMQGSGRSTRGPDDFSTIYVLDSNFVRVYAQVKSELATWFKESVVFV